MENEKKKGIHNISIKRIILIIGGVFIVIVLSLIIWGVILLNDMRSLGGGAPHTYDFGDISLENAKSDLVGELNKRWGIQIKDDWEILHATINYDSFTAMYLVKSSSDFNYEGFRKAILKGGIHRDGIKGRALEDDERVPQWKGSNPERRKEKELPSWWKPEELRSPRYVEIRYPNKPSQSGGVLWFFVISKEDNLIYIFQNKRW